jgi:ribosomal protein S18 acetylase RimI-like enzyme
MRSPPEKPGQPPAAFTWFFRLPRAKREGYALVMVTAVIDTRNAKPADAQELATVYEDAWTHTYRGVIPEIQLRRAISRRGPAYWRRIAIKAPSNNLVMLFDNKVCGYASFGINRDRDMPVSGEIYELYLAPEYCGTGLGRALFTATRRQLSEAGLFGLLVWSLSANRAACDFYQQMGGKIAGTSRVRFGEEDLERTAFMWAVKS